MAINPTNINVDIESIQSELHSLNEVRNEMGYGKEHQSPLDTIKKEVFKIAGPVLKDLVEKIYEAGVQEGLAELGSGNDPRHFPVSPITLENAGSIIINLSMENRALYARLHSSRRAYGKFYEFVRNDIVKFLVNLKESKERFQKEPHPRHALVHVDGEEINRLLKYSKLAQSPPEECFQNLLKGE